MRISDWSSDVCSSDLVARSRSARHRPQMTASAGPIGETEQQADVVTFLETPGALAPGETARRIDTHAAHIFLAGNRAWKLKRAVHRSEEHTSELQSLMRISYDVFCLKKNKNTITT